MARAYRMLSRPDALKTPARVGLPPSAASLARPSRKGVRNIRREHQCPYRKPRPSHPAPCGPAVRSARSSCCS
ncbi:hypothetical protein D3227_13065 [Mesorhizobium waimense]|uniref:Uncharacterized protein n=1 Tax=Mesorhizobium waimense TaxID=1300307 RepID=A0A3A5KTQ3_9HYPH|nr:hypothetical protein D3227_13065 [Mesorhizobium waimense]